MITCRSAVGAQRLYSTPVPLSHTLNMPKQCKRDEAHIRNFGHQKKKQCTSNHEDDENTDLQAIPPIPKKNRITLIYCYLLYIYIFCDFFELITVQIASVESKRAKQRWIWVHQSQKCHITWCPSVLHEPYLSRGGESQNYRVMHLTPRRGEHENWMARTLFGQWNNLSIADIVSKSSHPY